MQGRGAGIGLGGQAPGFARLGDVHIGQVGHLGQAARGAAQAVELTLVEQHAQGRQISPHRRQALTVQRIAQFEVVVQKAQRRTHGEGVQPQRGLGQLHRHRVLVDAEDGFLQDHAAHDVAVVELGIGDGPAMGGGRRADAAADVGDAGDHRAFPGPATLHQVRRPGLAIDQLAGVAGGLQHPVGQVIDQGHQKMPTAHGRVTDREFEDLGGRVEGVALASLGMAVELVPQRLGECAAFLPARDGVVKALDALGRQQAHRLTQDQPHQVVVGVIAARDLACKAGRAGDHAVDLGPVGGDGQGTLGGLHLMHQAVFEQALIDAAQVRDRQVAVVDPAAQPCVGMTFGAA